MIKKNTSRYFLKLLFVFYSIIGFFIYIPFIIIRIFRGKEDFSRIFERLGISRLYVDSDKKILWIHAASIGESKIALRICEELSQRKQDYNYLITTGTVTSSKVVLEYSKNSNIKIYHHFLPIDNYFVIKNFLSKWNPSLLIIIESELWPSLIYTVSLTKKIILVNASMSDRSFNRWKNFPFIIKSMLKKIDKILVQTKSDLKKFSYFSQNSEYLGSLKYSILNGPTENKKGISNFNDKYLDIIKNKKILFAYSTHPGEEEIIMECFQDIMKYIEDIVLIIAPRHIDRIDKLSSLFKRYNIEYALFSQNCDINQNIKLLIVDSYGNLNKIFKLEPISFTGGSFTVGGHNIIEPASNRALVIFGPDMSGFSEIAKEFLDNNAAFQIQDTESFKKVLIKILYTSKEDLNLIKDNALNIIDKNKKIGESYINKIIEYL